MAGGFLPVAQEELVLDAFMGALSLVQPHWYIHFCDTYRADGRSE